MVEDDLGAIAQAAARLSAVDDRFADFAAATGVTCGPLDPADRERHRVEIDARVARAWDLSTADLNVIFRDFTEDAVTPAYRTALVETTGTAHVTMVGRPSILDNLQPDTGHGDGLVYLTNDLDDHHALSVATGYVNLGGLHHVAESVGEERATRLLLGAAPSSGLGSEFPATLFERTLLALRKGNATCHGFRPAAR